MKTFKKGQRVIASELLGAGVIVGFEHFDKFGNGLPMVDEDPGEGRIIVQLDDPTRWAFHDKSVGLPHCFRREVQPELQTVCSSTDSKE